MYFKILSAKWRLWFNFQNVKMYIPGITLHTNTSEIRSFNSQQFSWYYQLLGHINHCLGTGELIGNENKKWWAAQLAAIRDCFQEQLNRKLRQEFPRAPFNMIFSSSVTLQWDTYLIWSSKNRNVKISSNDVAWQIYMKLFRVIYYFKQLLISCLVLVWEKYIIACFITLEECI